MIGCGGRGKAHAVGLQADERCDVVALVDPNAEAAEALNTEFGLGAKVYTDHREMLRTERPELVIVALWTPLHLPVFKDCVDAGVRAVHSEKPMAPTWGECREMAALAESSGVQLTFCHQRRFARGNQLARKLIAEGRFGKIERLDLYSPPNLLDCGTHTFDQALSFLGEPGVKWVMASVDTSKLLKWFDVEAEGMATGTIVFEGDVRAHFQTGGPDMDIWGGVRILGSEGFLEVTWDGEFRRGAVYADSSWQPPTMEPDVEGPMIATIRDAIDCMESGAEPELSYRKALRATEIIFACYESVRLHQRIELPLTGVEDNPLHALIAAR